MRPYNPPVPVVRIRALPQPSADVRAVTIAVARALALELEEPPHGTWVTWQTVDAYAEGGEAPAEQPPDTHPPVAIVLAYRGRDPETIGRMLQCVGDTLVRELDLEAGNVFVSFQELAPGHLYDAEGIRS